MTLALMKSYLLAFVLAASGADAGNFPTEWTHGNADCARSTDPPLQVHRFDADTFILRQNKCVNSEGPFLYMLIGSSKALLLDTGAMPTAGGRLPLLATVDRILGEHGTAGMELVVAHSHAHTDHTYGDSQFADRPRTTVVRPDVSSVMSFFRLQGASQGASDFDLGGRVLTILAIPGHEASHIAVYDAKTKILLTGDTAYPGLLTVRDWTAYCESAERLVKFTATHPVSHVLGAHIEMKRTPRNYYEPATAFQPEEHSLPLAAKHLVEIREVCQASGGSPRRDTRADFVVVPVP